MCEARRIVDDTGGIVATILPGFANSPWITPYVPRAPLEIDREIHRALSVLQILEIGGNILFSVFEYRRNLQPAAEFFVSFVDQKTLRFGNRRFE